MSDEPDSPPVAHSRSRIRPVPWVLAAIAVATVLAYANSFGVPFLFDDLASIVENPTIRHLWPPGEALSPPAEGGLTVSGRPLLNLSFALNYAVGGLAVQGYHAVNLAIHLVASAILYLLVRTTMRRGAVDSRQAARAEAVAFGSALLWAVHPLQTESVTYLVQRAEALMGLGVLASLYTFVRGLDSPRPWRWWTAAVTACWLAVAVKEVAVLIPVLALAYDRTFVAGSFKQALTLRGAVYAALVSAWLPLAWLVFGTGGNRGNTMGLGIDLPWDAYLATQPEAWMRYLKLSVWPAPLIFDYGKPHPVPWREAVVMALPLLPLFVAIIVGWHRRRAWAFLALAFCGLLAPTSLVPSIVQAIVEHRMYLPLAAVMTGLVGTLSLWLRPRVLVTVTGIVAAVFVTLTMQRNAVYADEERLWRDTVAKRPENARAHNNLGRVVQKAGRDAEAAGHYAKAAALDPQNAQAQFNLGLARFRLGDAAAALPDFERAVALIPEFGLAHLNRGLALIRLGRPAEARAALAEAVRHPPPSADAYFHLGVLSAEAGDGNAAEAAFGQALGLRPDWPAALSYRGLLRLRRGETDAALADLQRARNVAPAVAEHVFNLGLVEAARGRPAEAMRYYREALQQDPDFFAARLNLGIALGQSGQLGEAIEHLGELVRRHPASAEAQAGLGTAYLAARQPAAALAAYERALTLAPQDPQQHYNVGYALLLLNRWTEGRARLEEALRLRPDFAPALTLLQNMRAAPRP